MNAPLERPWMRARAKVPSLAARALCPHLSSPRPYVRANALAGLALSGARCGNGSAERASLAEDGSEDVRAIRRALPGQSFNAPGGPVTIDPENQHTWKTVRIAEIMGDGQFSVIWSSEKPIRPVPYPASRSVAKWDEFLAALHKRWQGHWGRPSPL